MSSKIRDLHDEAMDQSFFAMRAKSRGDLEESKRLFADALDKELAVLEELDALDEIVQPTHAVLHRSAATLALDCGDPDLAEKLAAKGLAQGPHREFAEELRDVIEQANHARHLETTGVELKDESIVAHVVKLEREPSEFDGRATILYVQDNQPLRIDVQFERKDYDLVIDAFKGHKTVRLQGDIHRAGQGYQLRNQRNLALAG